MSKVTKESLIERINHLEAFGSAISLNEEYQLEAFKMLLGYVSDCEHAWVRKKYEGSMYWTCEKCGETL